MDWIVIYAVVLWLFIFIKSMNNVRTIYQLIVCLIAHCVYLPIYGRVFGWW